MRTRIFIEQESSTGHVTLVERMNLVNVVYETWHNNYPFTLGESYDAANYKDGWLLIDGQLYRVECFEIVVGSESSE